MLSDPKSKSSLAGPSGAQPPSASVGAIVPYRGGDPDAKSSAFSRLVALRTISILLIGSTGDGKSALVNLIVNYFRGGTPDNIKVAIETQHLRPTETDLSDPESEGNLSDSSKSCTRKCCIYTLTDFVGNEIRIMDTPGLGDTEVPNQDEKNMAAIIEAAIQAGDLSAVILVSSGAQTRFVATVKLVLSQLRGNLPDAFMENNLLLVLTKCTRVGVSADVSRIVRELSYFQGIFYIDNQAFSTHPRIWRADLEQLEQVQFSWNQSMKVLRSLFDKIYQLPPTSTQPFLEMKAARHVIKSQISCILMEIRRLHDLQAQLEQAQTDFLTQQQSSKSYKDFIKKITIKSIKQVPSSHYNTVCMKHFTEKQICHQNCGLDFSSKSSSWNFYWCKAIDVRGYCRACGCGVSYHYHAQVEFREVEEVVETILDEIKAKHDSAANNAKKAEGDIRNISSDLDSVRRDLREQREEIEGLFRNLRGICSRFNFVDELSAIINVMRQQASTITSVEARAEADMAIKHLLALMDQFSQETIVGKFEDMVVKAVNHVGTGVATVLNSLNLNPDSNASSSGSSRPQPSTALPPSSSR